MSNEEPWVLFQLEDKVTERYSPVYCAPSVMAAKMECNELKIKQPNRSFILYILGTMLDGDFKPSREVVSYEISGPE